MANSLDSLDVSKQSLDHDLSLRNELDFSETKKAIEKLEKGPLKINRIQSRQRSPSKVPKKSKMVIRKKKDEIRKPINTGTEISKLFKCPHCDVVFAKSV